MDWDNVVADQEMLVPVHFTPGRYGTINKIVLHHNAGNLSIEGCYSVWLNREASAHYQIEEGGRIGQLVNDWDTAWHTGNENPYSIGIEHANDNFGPWTISQATLESGAHLVAALCKMYGLGEPQWGVNVFPHSYFMATSCPGEIAGSQNDQYMNRAREWYAAMTGGSVDPEPITPTVWDGPGVRLDGADAIATCAAVAAYARPDADHTLSAMLASHHDAVAGMWRAGQLGARLKYADGQLLAMDGYITAGTNCYGTQRWFDMAQRDSFGARLGSTCIVCSASSYQDAAAAGSVSYANGWPVVYFEDHANFYAQLEWYERVIVIGGLKAVPKLDKEAERWAGDTANGTMITVAEHAFSDWSRVAIANGSQDTVAACQLGVPVLPSAAAETVAALERHKPSNILWVGGLSTISYDRRSELCRAAGLQ